MKSIVLFMVYYGKLPNYFGIWLQSVKDNPSIDFVVVTDCLKNGEYDIPENVKIIEHSFEDLKAHFQKRFDFKISVDNYGRISQFRPALAYIFPEYVKGYDYWGFIECDLIFGDIRKFITDDILESHDKIFKLGHFQIFKNTEEMNMLFMRKVPSALDYKYAYKHNVLFFEELLGVHNIANALNKKTYTENVFADVKAADYRFHRSSYAYHDIDEKETYLFSYNKGHLYMYSKNDTIQKQEILYAHFQKRALEISTDNYEMYNICPNRFLPYKKIDEEYWDKVEKRNDEKEKKYQIMMQEKFDLAKKNNNKNFFWWVLRFKRVFIRKHGGVDLNGK